jgi:hypothetical protein
MKSNYGYNGVDIGMFGFYEMGWNRMIFTFNCLDINRC